MSFFEKKLGKILGTSAVLIGSAFVGLTAAAKNKKADSVYENEPEQKNQLEGKRVVFVSDENDKENADGVKGHLEAVENSNYSPNFYEKYIKRGMDVVLSFGGLVALSPVMGAIALAIKVEDPGPVLFTQKRMGQNKQYFKLHKFRSMRLDTPHDVPTHQLENPEQYITKVGKFIRAHSLDELPQIWDIFVGNMSVIGPRPGLWNQDLLTAERDKYGANDVKPGLTGLAQINGRDELEIEEKARLDGEYVKNLSFAFDVKCFLDSVLSVVKTEGVVEGGTGELKKELVNCHTVEKTDDEIVGQIGFGEKVEVDNTQKKSVLITGAGSYIGNYFKDYAEKNYPTINIDILDMLDSNWAKNDFSKYDIVYHVAGIAHADVGNVDQETISKYYKVNTDLAIEVCKKAKKEGVKEFIFMSSMIVYGDSTPYGKFKVIDENTVPKPANFYGNSKLQADVAVRNLASDNFKVLVIRPPMIYGKGSKGNYPILANFSKKLPVFPSVNNKRSMLYIENLCEFLCQIILIKNFASNSVVLMPQNSEYTTTSKMVEKISDVYGKKIILLGGFMKIAVKIGSKVPGKIGGLVNKAFGNSIYKQSLSIYPGINYQKYTLEESINRTEKSVSDADGCRQKHILVVSQYFYPETFRINDICKEWVKQGYKVTVLTGIPNYPMGKIFDGYGLFKNNHEIWNGIEIFRIPLIPRGTNSIGMIMNYISFMINGIVVGGLKNIKADYVFSFEVSPMTQVLVGISFSKHLHIPHYLYVQDLWPENVMTVTGISNPLIIKPINKMVDYIYKNTDQIFATSPSFVDAICNRKINVPKEKVHYWPQYAEEIFVPQDKIKSSLIPDDDSFKIIFTGNIGTAQGLEILPSTAKLLKEDNVKFVIVGDGRYLEEFTDSIKKMSVEDKFVMIPRQPIENIPELLCSCDAAFVSFSNDQLWAKTIPAKLQSYMACAMPIIASAQGETERIIKEAQCGICCEIGNTFELSSQIKKMMNQNLLEMKQNSRDYFEKNFDKKKLLKEIDNYFI